VNPTRNRAIEEFRRMVLDALQADIEHSLIP